MLRNTRNRISVCGVGLFDQKQIAEFKEAFTRIDQDGDGLLQAHDLERTLQSLGLPTTSVESMLAEASGSINFTTFLTIFSEKIANTNTEKEINEAFEAFAYNGVVDTNALTEAMTSMNDRFSVEEMEVVLQTMGFTHDNNFDYKAWTKALKFT